MKFDEYQELALRTDCPITDEVRARYRTASPVIARMFLREDPTSDADAWKRYVYYGTELPAGLRGQTTSILKEAIEVVIKDDDATIRLVHAVLGMLSELREVLDVILDPSKVPEGQTFEENLFEESGDLKWYGALFDAAINADPVSVARANILKLCRRFPKKFEARLAVERDVLSEQEALKLLGGDDEAKSLID